MKRSFTLSLAVVLSAGSYAQSFPYLIQAFQEPYQPLESPIDITNGELWDDPEWMVYPPFPINYMEDTLTEFMVSGPGCQISQNFNTEPLVDVLIPYMADLMNASPDAMVSPVGYEVAGAAPNRIFKMEWSNAGFYDEYDQTGNFANLVNFQLWFYETTGSFRVHFGPNTIKSADAYQIFGKPTLLFAKNIDFMSADFANEGFWSLAGDASNPTINYIPQFTGFLGTNELLSSDPVNGQVYYFYTLDNVGVAEQTSTELGAYPNPAQDYIFVQSSQDDVISIFDMTGKLVATQSIKNGTQAIQLSGLAAGMYVMKSQANPVLSKRITKQ
jgi:hypothetical protein